MAGVWKDIRKQERAALWQLDQQRRRANESRARDHAKTTSDPFHSIRIVAKSIEITRDQTQYEAQHSTRNMMEWGGASDIVLIDRFDGRSLLDAVSLSRPSVHSQGQSNAELELESKINYERYSAIIEHVKSKYASEAAALDAMKNKFVDEDAKRSAYAPTLTELQKQERELKSRTQPKRQEHEYARIGFSYETQEATPSERANEEREHSTESMAEEPAAHERHEDEYSKLLIPEPKSQSEADNVNKLAFRYGIRSYNRFVRQENRQRKRDIISVKSNEVPRFDDDGRISRRDRRRMRQVEQRRLRRELGVTNDDRSADEDSDPDDTLWRDGNGYSDEEFSSYDNDSDVDDGSGRDRFQRDVPRQKEAPKPERQYIEEFTVQNTANSRRQVVSYSDIGPDTVDSKRASHPPSVGYQRQTPSQSALPTKLTDAEKLNLKMQQQLEKTIQKDYMASQRKQAEKDAEARQRQEEQRAMRLKYGGADEYGRDTYDGGKSYYRRRSPSRSPPPRKRSRSRSRSRSPHRNYLQNRSHRSRSRSRDRRSQSPPPSKRQKDGPTTKPVAKDKKLSKVDAMLQKLEAQQRSKMEAKQRSKPSIKQDFTYL